MLIPIVKAQYFAAALLGAADFGFKLTDLLLEFKDIVLIHTAGFKLVFVPGFAGFLLGLSAFAAGVDSGLDLPELIVERANDFLPVGLFFHARFERLLFLLFEPELMLMLKLL